MTTTSEAERILAERQSGVGAGAEALIVALNRASDDCVRQNVVRALPDRELLIAVTWIEHTDAPDPNDPSGAMAVINECRHRAEQGRTFAAYLNQS